MDVLPLIVHSSHPQNSTDEEQQHCNCVTSSVHEQPERERERLLRNRASSSQQSVSWQHEGSMEALPLVLNARDEIEGSSPGNVA